MAILANIRECAWIEGPVTIAPESLLKLSIGLEHIADLGQALRVLQ